MLLALLRQHSLVCLFSVKKNCFTMSHRHHAPQKSYWADSFCIFSNCHKTTTWNAIFQWTASFRCDYGWRVCEAERQKKKQPTLTTKIKQKQTQKKYKCRKTRLTWLTNVWKQNDFSTWWIWIKCQQICRMILNYNKWMLHEFNGILEPFVCCRWVYVWVKSKDFSLCCPDATEVL